jgi:serine protease Do
MANRVELRRSTAVLVLLAASIGGGLIAAFTVASRGTAPMYTTALADTSTQRLEGLSNSFADVIEKASPSVVNIQSTRVIKASEQQQGGNGDNPMMQDPFFRQFFGGQLRQGRPHAERESGEGSGIIIDPRGYILTNNHVVDKATSVRVTLLDKREFTAKVIGTDPQTDVAVVKIDAGSLQPLPLGNSDSARVGDLCFAIGNPFGYDHTVTMGIVSAKGRSLEGNTHIQNFIQTDAAINPGNSGGALINARGQLIGMNTAIITGGSSFGGEAGNIGIGFAVPVNLAKSVMDQIISSGKVSRGYMGVSLERLDPALAEKLGLKDTHGAIIGEVTPGGPGANAGLQQLDVVVGFDGNKVEDYNELTLDVISKAPGTSVTLDVIRNGKPMKVTVKLGTRPTAVDFNRPNQGGDNGSSDQEDNGASVTLRGITVQDVTPEIAQQLQSPSITKGVAVTDIDQASSAAGLGTLARGSIITAIERHPVNNVGDFKRLMNENQGKAVLLTLVDGGQTFFAVLPAK